MVSHFFVAFRSPAILAFSLVFALTASALPETTSEYEIEAQSIDSALVEFSKISDVQVLMPGGSMGEVFSVGVSGEYSAVQALEILLSDTGLVYRETGKSTIAILTADQADADLATFELEPISLTGSKIPEWDDKVQLEEVELTAGREVFTFAETNASTATMIDLSLEETPFNIGVVNEALIDDLQIDRLEDAILLNASVVRSHSHSSNATQYIIRGFSLQTDRAGYLVNGVPVSSFDAPPAHTSALERIEVLKGAASLFYGAGEPAGVINFVYKDPLPEEQYSIKTTVGSYDKYSAEFDATGPITENFFYRFTLGVQDSKGVVDYDYSKDFAPTLQFQWNPFEKTSIRLIAERVEHEGNPISSNVFYLNDDWLELSKSTYYGFSTDFEEQESDGIQLMLEQEITDDLKFVAQGGYKKGNREAGNSGYLIAPPGLAIPGPFLPIPGLQPVTDFDNGISSRSAFDQQRGSETSYAGGHFIWEKELAGMEHQLLIGANYSKTKIKNQGYFNSIAGPVPVLLNPFSTPAEQAAAFAQLFALPPAVNIFDPDNPAYDHLTNYEDSPPFTQTKLEYEEFGINLQDAINIPELNLSILAGLRYSESKSSQSESFGQDGAAGVIRDDVSESAWVPRIGGVYGITDDHSIYASYAQSYLPQGGLAIDRNDNLITEPEEGTQYELGLRSSWFDGKLSSTIAIYDLTKENILGQDPIDPDASVLVGEVRSRGLEVDVTGQINDFWNIYLSYAYTDTEVIDAGTGTQGPGDRFLGVPYNKLVIWNSFDLDGIGLDGFTFGYGIDYMDDGYGNGPISATLTSSPTDLPAQGIIHNMNITYTTELDFGELYINLGVKNITDHFYVLNTTDVTFAKRGEPRTFYLTAGLTF